MTKEQLKKLLKYRTQETTDEKSRSYTIYHDEYKLYKYYEGNDFYQDKDKIGDEEYGSHIKFDME